MRDILSNNKINLVFYAQFLFFIFVSTLSLFIFFNNSNLFDQLNFNVLCFILIATIGVSHGAIDHKKGEYILNKMNYKNYLFLFYLAYLFFFFLVLFFWSKFSLVSLVIFFIISSFHFGSEDTTIFLKQPTKLENLFYFARGSIIIATSFYLNFNETYQFIQNLLFENSNTLFHEINWIYIYWINLIFLFTLLIILLIQKKISISSSIIIFIEVIFIALNFYFLPLLLAFTLYFCFMHSTKHIMSLSYELDHENPIHGLKKFLVMSFPLTLITFTSALIMLFYLGNNFSLNSSIIKIIFIGLASLTLPHIILGLVYDKYKKY